MGLFIAPAAFHQIVEKGHLSEDLNRFVSRVTTVGLIPFAVAMGIDAYTISTRALQSLPSAVVGILVLVTALFCWYGLEMIALYREQGNRKETPAMDSEPTDLKDRIKFILMEARVVLPGVQALLGFQFAAVLTDSFEKLPGGLKSVHLASLFLVAFCTILVMTPASYHRIVERGQSTERMEKFSRRMVLASMALLAPGIAGDVLVVTERALHSLGAAIAAGGFTLLAFYGFWFGYMFVLRSRYPENAEHQPRTTTPLSDK